MAALYDKARHAFLTGDIDADTATWKMTLVTSGYAPDFVNNQYMNTTTVPASTKLSTVTVTFAGGRYVGTNGTLDCDDPTFTAVGPSGSTIVAAILWTDGGDGGTSVGGTVSRLVGYFDGLNILANTGNITLNINASGLFKL